MVCEFRMVHDAVLFGDGRTNQPTNKAILNRGVGCPCLYQLSSKVNDRHTPPALFRSVHILINTSLFHTEIQGQNKEDRVEGVVGQKMATKRGISMTINIPAVGADMTKEAVNQFNEALGQRLSPRHT